MAGSATKIDKPIPFDAKRLDALLEDAGIDVLIATSKHNIQYLLGGYRFFFFDTMDAAGLSRYLPVLVYQKGRPDSTAYIGCGLESYERELGRFWPPTVVLEEVGSEPAMRHAAAHVKKLGAVRTIGVERAFLPDDAAAVLRQGLAQCESRDATFALERLRAKKTPTEIDSLRKASEGVVAAMVATFRQCAPGMTKREVVQTLRREEVSRGLTFDYCLLTAGTSLNRAPSSQRLAAGDILSLDSGGNYDGYIGDLCRMGILGKPDQELVDLLGFVDEVQHAGRKHVRPGARGGDVVEVPQAMLDRSPHRSYTHYMAHGMGLVTHEAPRLMDNPRMSYDAYDASRPLESGMVVSIETTLAHPSRGFVKLEDTVLVTPEGNEALGDGARGWNQVQR